MMGMVVQVLPLPRLRLPSRNVCFRLGPNLSLGAVLVNGDASRDAALVAGRRRDAAGRQDAYIWTIGRTSTAPTEAAGHLAANATASSKSFASTT